MLSPICTPPVRIQRMYNGGGRKRDASVAGVDEITTSATAGMVLSLADNKFNYSCNKRACDCLLIHLLLDFIIPRMFTQSLRATTSYNHISDSGYIVLIHVIAISSYRFRVILPLRLHLGRDGNASDADAPLLNR